MSHVIVTVQPASVGGTWLRQTATPSFVSFVVSEVKSGSFTLFWSQLLAEQAAPRPSGGVCS